MQLLHLTIWAIDFFFYFNFLCIVHSFLFSVCFITKDHAVIINNNNDNNGCILFL